MSGLLLLIAVIAVTGAIALICLAADKIEAWARGPKGAKFFNTKE